MEPDRGGKRKGENGGRSGRVHWAREYAGPEYRRLIFGEGLEREHKRNMRQQAMRSSRGGPWGWNRLSPMAQHEFTMNIACPQIIYHNGVEPSPLELARLAPITWGDLGIPFNMAFKNKQEW